MNKKIADDERIHIEDLIWNKILTDKPALAGIICKWSDLIGSMRSKLQKWLKDTKVNADGLSEAVDVWYRGVYSSQTLDKKQTKKWISEYALTPKIQRQDYNWSIEQERVMYLEFERLSEGIGAPSTPLYWSTYFKMQHYGMPTRLLDWTEGFLIALYFAVDAPKLSIEGGLPIQDKVPAAVFVLFPQILNFLSWSNSFSNKSQLPRKEGLDKKLCELCLNTFHYTVDSKLLNETLGQKKDEPVDQNYPMSEFELCKHNEEDYPKFPIAIRPSYQDQRIRGQRSVFTLHGQSFGFEELIKEIHKDHGPERIPFLGVIEIEKEKATQIKNELMQMGISRRVLFPDLGGLTEDTDFELRKGIRSKFPFGKDWEKRL